MNSVFILEHAYGQDGYEKVKLIGVYSSEENAKAAIERLKLQPGFCRWPDNFHINEYILDEDSWSEGFAAMRPIQAMGKDGVWTTVSAAVVDDNLYKICDRGAEDFLQALKYNDVVECEKRDGEWYVTKQVN